MVALSRHARGREQLAGILLLADPLTGSPQLTSIQHPFPGRARARSLAGFGAVCARPHTSPVNQIRESSKRVGLARQEQRSSNMRVNSWESPPGRTDLNSVLCLGSSIPLRESAFTFGAPAHRARCTETVVDGTRRWLQCYPRSVSRITSAGYHVLRSNCHKRPRP